MADSARRVAVTGIGLVSPAGCEIADFWSRIVAGKTAIGRLRGILGVETSTRLAAQALDFEPGAHFENRRLATLDRHAQFAVVAARAALTDSGLALSDEDREEAAVILGTGIGGIGTLDEAYRRFYGEGSARVHPLTIPKMMANGCASHVSIDLGLRGESYALVSACASGTHAIGNAFRMIRSGATDLALAGGSEASLTPATIAAWEALRVMSSEGCRPFSATRTGMVLGEGAAVLMLEEAERARRRGARLYGYVEGYGATSDAAELTTPSIDGPSRAIAAALRTARLGPDGVDYVNAHGTGTAINDVAETRAIRSVFGSAADRLMVSSSKAVLGHALGASGALEAAVALLALSEGIVPPTAGWEAADPECDLDVVPNSAREAQLRAVLSNSFGFGGLNAVIAFTRA